MRGRKNSLGGAPLSPVGPVPITIINFGNSSMMVNGNYPQVIHSPHWFEDLKWL